LPDAFTLAHLARAIAASLAFAAAGIFRCLALGAAFDTVLPFNFAHLARCAFAMRARAEADIFRLVAWWPEPLGDEPMMRSSFCSSDSIFALILRARFSSAVDGSDISWAIVCGPIGGVKRAGSNITSKSARQLMRYSWRMLIAMKQQPSRRGIMACRCLHLDSRSLTRHGALITAGDIRIRECVTTRIKLGPLFVRLRSPAYLVAQSGASQAAALGLCGAY